MTASRAGAERATQYLLTVSAQAGNAATDRLVDRLGAGCEASLHDGEREADSAPPAVGLLGPVHLRAYVLGDLFVQEHLLRGEGVLDGLSHPLGEKRLAVEGEQVLLDHPTHQSGGVGGVHSLAVLAVVPVGVQQGKERLKVGLRPGVRSRGHEQEVPGDPAEQLAQLVAASALEFVAEPGRAHTVGLVHDDEVPLRLREYGLPVFVTGQLIHARDQHRVMAERVTVPVGFREVARQDRHLDAELLRKLGLPLLNQPTRGDDQATLHVTAEQQLLEVEAGHDRLPGARIVREQETQGAGLGQHGAVNGPNLVGQGIDVTGLHRQHRIRQTRVPHPQRLGGQPELPGVGVERPPRLRRLWLQRSYVAGKEHLVGQLPEVVSDRHLQGRADLCDSHDRDRP